MPDFTFFEIHFHEFNPTNTAPLIGRGGASREVGRGGAAGGANLDGVPVEEAEPESESGSNSETESRSDAETADDGSGGPGAGLVVALALLVVAAVAARKFLGGDDEFEELSEIDDVA